MQAIFCVKALIHHFLNAVFRLIASVLVKKCLLQVDLELFALLTVILIDPLELSQL